MTGCCNFFYWNIENQKETCLSIPERSQNNSTPTSSYTSKINSWIGLKIWMKCQPMSKIKESSAYDRANPQVNGNYGEFTEEFLCSEKAKNVHADHALVFMLRTINSKLVQPFASFASLGAASGDILAKLFLSCLMKINFMRQERNIIGQFCPKLLGTCRKSYPNRTPYSDFKTLCITFPAVWNAL